MNILAITTQYEGGTRLAFTVKIDEVIVFDVYDGEPEDNNLYRNFSDCFKVVKLLKRAWEAGRDGEKFSVTEKSENHD